MKRNNRSKSYQLCESFEKLNKKGILYQKASTGKRNKRKYKPLHRLEFEKRLIDGTAFLDLVYISREMKGGLGTGFDYDMKISENEHPHRSICGGTGTQKTNKWSHMSETFNREQPED
jgi:hypothetical protein